MSHIQTLNEAKQRCDTAGQCSEYQSQLQHENAQIDAHTASAVQSTITWGIVVATIGLAILLTPFIKPLQKFQSFILPKLAIVAPVLIGLVGGAFAGFAISFSACFKQSCSPVESTAMFTIPFATLIVTIPLAQKIYRKRQAIAIGVLQPKTLIWVIIGSIIILVALASVVNGVAEDKRSGERQKKYLLNSEL